MSRCCCKPADFGSCDCTPLRIQAIDDIVTVKDRLKKLAFRLGIGRTRMKVLPGLYALGSPGPQDPVLVSANFRITFDQLRADMSGQSAWLLILDTHGVNVWCAAGKGTFGTEELIRRIESSGLGKVVSHNNLILPQLGAPGIRAHEVVRRTGFRIHYGPVSSADLPDYIRAGMKAVPEMRRRKFPFTERLELVPLELIQSWKVLLGLISVSIVPSLFLEGLDGLSFIYHVVPVLLAVAAGACITPLLLPIIPGRAFALKGALSGGVVSALFIWVSDPPLPEAFLITGVMTAGASYLAMKFTGASTFTSLSGVKKEIRYGLPFQIGILVLAVTTRILLEILMEGGTGT